MTLQRIRIESDHTSIVRQQGIDVDFADIRVLGDQCRQCDERSRNGIHIGRRAIPVTPKQSGDPRTCYDVAREAAVERRQAQGGIGDRLD